MVNEDAKVVFFKKSCRRDLVSKAIVLTLFVTSKMPIRKSPFLFGKEEDDVLVKRRNRNAIFQESFGK